MTSPYEPVSKSPDVLAALSYLMNISGDILIESPYVICDESMYDLLKRQSNVTVMINAVESGANPFGCTDYLCSKERVLTTGVNVCEIPSGRSLHNKTFIIGDKISAIGSYNLDMRSNYICAEVMLVIDSRELNRQLRDSFAQKMSYGKLVSGNTVEYGANYTARKLSADKKLIYGFLSLLLPFFRHLL